MRLLSFVMNGNPRYGAATANGVVDLSRRFGSKFPDLRSLIAGEGLDEARAVAAEPPDYALDDLALLPPIPEPGKLWCIGVNYKDRNAEYKDGSDLPKYPSLFVRNPESILSAPGSRSKSPRSPTSSTTKASWSSSSASPAAISRANRRGRTSLA